MFFFARKIHHRRLMKCCVQTSPSSEWSRAIDDISDCINLENSLSELHIPHFMLCAPTHTHPLSRKFPGRLEAAPTKQPEKGPRWQLRGARGEARARITINEVNRIPAKCAVRTVFARSLLVCWGHISANFNTASASSGRVYFRDNLLLSTRRQGYGLAEYNFWRNLVSKQVGDVGNGFF